MGAAYLWRRVTGAIASSCTLYGSGAAMSPQYKALVLACALLSVSVPQAAQARLQCVPFARAQSGIEIFGNASTWWSQAAGVYARGNSPREGAVLAIAPSRAMPIGHVAVVSQVVDARHILIDHANWSSPGQVERGVLAEDVSSVGDWSAVRVWYAPSKALGRRVNAVRGFIYPDRAAPQTQLADQDPHSSERVLEAVDRALLNTKQLG